MKHKDTFRHTQNDDYNKIKKQNTTLFLRKNGFYFQINFHIHGIEIGSFFIRINNRIVVQLSIFLHCSQNESSDNR